MNLSNIIHQGAQYFPAKEAIVFENRPITYKELNDGVNSVASYLRDLGIRPKDRVALYCENRPEWIMLYYGIIRCGAIIICMSSAYQSTEIEYLLKDSEPVCIVTSENLLDNIPGVSEISQNLDILVIERDRNLNDQNIQVLRDF